MPEITSVEAIRRKLQEFEERIDVAIEAAGAVAQVRTDAKLLLSEIEALSLKAQQSLSYATAAEQQLQRIGQEFERWKNSAEAAQVGLEQTRSRIAGELDSAVCSIADKLRAVEERLQRTAEEALSTQAELLKGLDESTRGNAHTAERAASLADERARQLEQLLCTLRSELGDKISSELSSTEELVKSQFDSLRTRTEESILSSTQRLHADFDRAAQTLAEAAAGHGVVIRQEIDSFKAEMARKLSEHRQDIDRQVTDFLNKQNSLVQNLTQQIDSYHGVSNALSAQLTAVTTQLGQFTSNFIAHAAGVGKRLDAQDKAVHALSERMEEITQKLAKRSWLPWGK